MLSIRVLRESRAPSADALTSGERRVALDPATAGKLAMAVSKDAESPVVTIESGAGTHAFFNDEAYADTRGVTVADDDSGRGDAELVLCVRPPEPEAIDQLAEGSVLVGLLAPFQSKALIERCKARKITALSMELVPRISRAQSMDALSSQAAAAGYHCALTAAHEASVFFPMLTTAAGTIRPARVIVVGAGVAGLQAIATARRLGAQVWAYDIRAAAREQVESLGAKMIDTGVDASGEGGYARELTEDEKAKQAEALAKHLSTAHAVITTAAIPGRRSPQIISEDMVKRMQPGSVIVDLAAEGGGNCALTKAGETVMSGGVKIIGPTDIASELPVNASEMYAKNLFNLLSPFIEDGELKLDFEDAVIGPMCITRNGDVVHDGVRKALEESA
ncbi:MULTISPECIES: NAD(P) transhydrogenase subunit alpha [Larsenimonas]|uniref:proton-translocating NAD(P)(+) transhydrogenase n=1 Tax=Larsenimonas suaedae TaxID=1851019 RepID=A0ABU1GU16_9GAMM|nr:MULTISPECIES: NAD(P) transhydrogenase subunit alpha [Larsenimonas]MCM2971968.1 NAD(P) transhydrogenase subunit alpha [Larsenimonas suaedae]MCM5705352.1 NAD(P) transhydrogenase subunit alpha [Larsenimonas salina]MDR5895520.1 NAD(P) transhydrogenase subunit alpha [Larsenimonas suaedae]